MSVPASVVMNLETTEATIAILRQALFVQANNLRASIAYNRALPTNLTTDAGIAAEHIDAACDALLEAIDTIKAFIPEPCSTCGHGDHATCPCRNHDLEPEPHGSRDTFVPHPTKPTVCPACNHDLELNADFRCVRCGAQA